MAPVTARKEEERSPLVTCARKCERRGTRREKHGNTARKHDSIEAHKTNSTPHAVQSIRCLSSSHLSGSFADQILIFAVASLQRDRWWLVGRWRDRLHSQGLLKRNGKMGNGPLTLPGSAGARPSCNLPQSSSSEASAHSGFPSQYVTHFWLSSLQGFFPSGQVTPNRGRKRVAEDEASRS